MSSLALHLYQAAAYVGFLVYSGLVTLHFVVQVVFAHLAHRRAARHVDTAGFAPSVDVVVPIYNEDPESLELCLASIAHQRYDGPLEVYLVDDGSPNREEVLPLLTRYGAKRGWHVILPEQNAGKRHAQDHGIRVSRGSAVVTIDSDTVIAPDGIQTLVRGLRDPRVGAITGNVRVSNARTNLLTRLIDMRYWVAFNQERAAQSFFGAVLCCSGPFSVYRREVLDRIWPDYMSQTFKGVPCTYGDDRHLTNLVLKEGYRTLYDPLAVSDTYAPTGMRQYLRQQLRWNKSYYRELLWTLDFLPRLPRFITFEVFTQALLPILLILAILSTGVGVALDGPGRLLSYGLAVVGMALLHCVYAAWRTRRIGFALFVVYGFLHAGLLIPIRLRALSTLTDNKWGTRLEPQGVGAAHELATSQAA